MNRVKFILAWLYDQAIYPIVAAIRGDNTKPGNQANDEKGN